MRIGSVFSGIGGLDLGLERSGVGEVDWQIEIDPFRQCILKKHWPKAVRFTDIRVSHPPETDMVVGGFPCQDISDACHTSKRLGLNGKKSALWKEQERVIKETRPEWVVVENVRTWRRWVPDVRQSLFKNGYTSVSFSLRADSFGAPFYGERVFVVAKTNGNRQSTKSVNEQMAVLSKFATSRRENWGLPSSRALGVVDGVPLRMERLAAVGDAVMPLFGEIIGCAIRSVL